MTTTVLSPVDGAGLDADAELLLRVSAEFHEMPDLAVTVAEASRLFALDHGHCRRILHTLVSTGLLSTDGRLFAKAGTGRRSV